MTYENEVRTCIAVQKLGKATNSEIYKKLSDEKVKITLKQVTKATTNLQKRGLLSLNYDNSKGFVEKAYSLSKSIFKRDIPIAQYKDIVDTSNPDIKDLIEELEEQKKTSKGRLPDHRDYVIFNVVFEVKDKILGFMPFVEEGFNQHYRQGDEIILLPTHFRAWFGTNLRLINKPESAKNYIGFNYGKIKVKGKLGVEQFPVLDGRQGRGIVKYEVIPAGSIISTIFRIPTSDFTVEEFRKFLETICEMPIRGLSGRAITGYGHLKLLEIKEKL